MEDIRTVELFAGVGGFRLGLEKASDKYRFIWANQWEPSMHEQYAFDCYEAHFGKSNAHVCRDIAKAKGDVPDHDLLVGGFPCQDYSIMKKNSAGIEGAKGVLWWQIDDIMREKRPKYVLLENVKNLYRHNNGNTYARIEQELQNEGYHVFPNIFNTIDFHLPPSVSSVIFSPALVFGFNQFVRLLIRSAFKAFFVSPKPFTGGCGSK